MPDVGHFSQSISPAPVPASLIPPGISHPHESQIPPPPSHPKARTPVQQLRPSTTISSRHRGASALRWQSPPAGPILSPPHFSLRPQRLRVSFRQRAKFFDPFASFKERSAASQSILRSFCGHGSGKNSPLRHAEISCSVQRASWSAAAKASRA